MELQVTLLPGRVSTAAGVSGLCAIVISYSFPIPPAPPDGRKQ